MSQAERLLSIGELASQVGLRTSALRYYETEGLLAPASRSEAGYRQYEPEAVQRLRFIQRAQRLGFSLADIRRLLAAWSDEDLDSVEVAATAEARHLALEREITDLLVQRHELQLFLRDLQAHSGARPHSLFDQLVERICADPRAKPPERQAIDWLVHYTNCVLDTEKGQALLARLRGQHVHVWKEERSYYILVVSDAPDVADALNELAALEDGCVAHTTPVVTPVDEGFLFVAEGENAFIFARLFLALEEQVGTSGPT